MVSEYELPCTECGHSLVRATIQAPNAGGVAVAECSNCGTRHYPEAALDAFRYRTQP